MLSTPTEPMTTRMSSKGQIVIPRKACEALGVHAGTEFTLSIEGGGYRLVPKKNGLEAFFALAGKVSSKGGAPALSTHDEIGDFLMKKDQKARTQSKSSRPDKGKKQ